MNVRAKWFRSVALGAAAVAALLVVAHLPPVQSRILGWGLDRLPSTVGIRANVQQGSYNLLTRTGHLSGVSMSAAGDPNTPFGSVDRVSVKLSWAVWLGRVEIEAVEAEALRIDIVRGVDGRLNLPMFPASTGAATASRFPIGRVAVRNASLSYRDLARDLEADLGGVELTLDPEGQGTISGRLVASEPPSFRIGQIGTRGTRLEGGIRYDGAGVFIGHLAFDTPEARLQIDARLESLWSVPRVESQVSGTLPLSGLSSMLAVSPVAQGTVMLQANVTGPLSAPVASIALESDGVSWRHLGPAGFRSHATLAPTALSLDEARFSLGGGTLDVRGNFGFSAGSVEVLANWQSLPAASVLGPLAPVALAARLNGGAELTGNVVDAWSEWQARVENRSRSDPAGAATVPVEGTLVATLIRGRWNVRHAHVLSSAVRLAGESAGVLSSGLPGSSPLNGFVDVSATDLSRALPLLRTMGVTIPPPLRPQTGALDARLQVKGTLAAPELSGDATLADLRFPGAGPIHVESSVVLSSQVVSVADLRASLGTSHVSGSGRLEVPSRAVRAGLEVEVPDLTVIAGLLPDQWRPAGALSSRVKIAGTVPQLVLRGQIAGTDLSVAGQRADTISALVSYEDGALAVRQLEIQQADGGRLAADGEYVPESGSYVLAARATAMSLGPLGDSRERWPMSAIFDGHFQGRGTLVEPVGSGYVSFAKLDWGGTSLGPVAADVTLADGAALFNVELRELSTEMAASVRLYAPQTFDIVVDARDTDVSRLVRNTGRQGAPMAAALAGRVSARIAASGELNDLPAATVEAALRQVDLHVGEARLQLMKPVTARYADHSLEMDAFQVRSGSSVIVASGAVGQVRALRTLNASLRGELSDLEPWLAALGASNRTAVSGIVAADFAATGSLEHPTLTGQVTLEHGTVVLQGYPGLTDVTMRAGLSGGVIDVTALTTRWGDAAVEGRLNLPLGLLSEWLPVAVTAASPPSSEATLVGGVTGLTASSLEAFAGKPIADTVEGRVSLAVTLRSEALTFDRVRGTFTLPELQLRIGGVPLTQVRPTQIVIADGRAHVADWTWDAAGNRLTVAGQAALGGTRELDLRAAGHVDLRLARAFVPEWATGGLAVVSVHLGGSLLRPLADGTLEIRGGELRVADPQIVASNIEGRIVLQGQSLRIEELAGSLNGGRFTAAGEVLHDQRRLVDGVITLTGSGIALNVPAGVRTGVDTALTLSLSRDRTRLSGSVTVQRGAYREPLSLAAGFIAAARQRASTVTIGRPSSTLDRLDLDVAIVSEQDLVVDNNYGRMDIGLDLRLVGTVAQPSVVGRAAIREGGIMYLGGRTYQIESGSIDFTNPRAVVPDLNLTARTRIAAYDVTLALAGAPDSVRATLSSDPSLAQADIVSLLATGRLADDVGGAGTQIAREQVLGYLSGEALGLAGRAIGLDTLRFESGSALDQMLADPSLIAGEADPASRLTVSKRFSRYVEVVLSQNLREEGRFTWIVAYTPREDIELRSVSRDDRSRSYEARHSVTFGGATETAGAAKQTTAGAREERILAIRFAGAPGFPEQELRRELALKPGNRFDFYRWQQDRERLRRFVVEQGYLEARVSTRRSEDSDAADRAGIVLEYDIDRGPLARLQFEGYTPPARRLRELEAIWSNAVFDEALVADLERSVRGHLVEDGFLQPQVAVSLQESALEGEKRITIVVAPGGQTRAREIRFEGHREMSRERLDALIAAVGWNVVWIEPTVLAREVEALYRQEGFLAVQAVAEPLRFAGETAVRSVRIEEGSRFVLSRVSIAGVEARSEEDVRRAFGQAVGDRYFSDDLERGRRAVESDYAREGFNAVHASVATEADPTNGTVQVTLTIDEGPREVLKGVVTERVSGVHPDVIADALQLEPGTPVDMAEWYGARRRLLDTGLFRRVDIDAIPVAENEPMVGDVEVQARVSLDRQPVWRLRYGLDITDEAAPASEGRAFGGGLTADLQRRGLFGRAGSFGGSLRAKSDQQIGRTFVTLPSFFAWPITSNLFLSRSHQRIEEAGFLAFVTDKTAFTAEQRVRLARSLQISYGYQFERNHTFDPNRDPDDPFGLDLTVNAARLTSTTVIDTRNDAFDASRGFLHSSNLEYAPAVLGSDVRFVKYFMQQFVYIPLGTALVSASAFRLGVGRGFGQDLLPNERFFAGGGNTVRGLAENVLGGTDALGDPRGGHAMVVMNQEVRFPIHRWLRGVTFVDAGNVFGRARDLSLRDMAVGAGGGLRFSTPLGLFRLDVGVPLSRLDDRRRPRWHFSFGQMF